MKTLEKGHTNVRNFRIVFRKNLKLFFLITFMPVMRMKHNPNKSNRWQHSHRKISKGEMILDEIGITTEMVLNDIHKFAGDGEMMVDGIMPDVGPCSKLSRAILS